MTCLAVLCALSAPALASPRSDPTMGRAVFTGATMPNATSIDVNPGALGLGVRDEIYLAAMSVIDRYVIDRKTLDIDTGGLSTAGHVSEHVLSPGVNAAAIWHPGTDGRITLGVLLRSSPAQRFLENQDALRYHTLGGDFRTYSGSIAASFRLTRRFYFGISLAAQSSYLKLKYARDAALEAGHDPARGVDSDCNGSRCGVENPASAERYTVDVHSDLFSASNVVAVNLGFVVQLGKDMWLGFAYHAPPGLGVQNQLLGTIDVERAPRDGGGRVSGGSTVYLSQPATFDAEYRTRLPRDLDLHVGLRWEHLSRLQNYDVRAYGSAFPQNDVPEWMPRVRGFNNAYAIWGGIEQAEVVANEQFPVRFGGRIGFESASVSDDKTTPMTIAPSSVTLDGGAEVRLGDRVVLQATYGLQYFPTVNVTDSAFDPRDRLACFDSGFDYSTTACKAVRDGYAIPTAAGDYSRLEHAMRVGLRIEFP